MKTIKTNILILFICLSTKDSIAQLQNNAWKGTFNTPSLTECVFEFKTDTVYLKLASDFNVDDVNDGTILETSVYTTDHDTLTLQKVAGVSPCDNELVGKYLFIIKNDKLSIFFLEDNCSQRAMAFPREPLTKIKK